MTLSAMAVVFENFARLFILVNFCHGFLLNDLSKLPGLNMLHHGKSLEHQNVDRSQISVSGVSSGATMAAQIHVIFSSHIMGVGLVAGAPFSCSQGQKSQEMKCMTQPSEIKVSDLIATTESKARHHSIDSTSHMAHDKVYIFNGEEDSVVNPGIGEVTKSYYQHFITEKENIKTVFNRNAENGMPTDNYGGACDRLSHTDFINNCNYSAASHLLNHIYGGHLTMPTKQTTQAGKLKHFSQSDFFHVSLPAMSSMDTVGYVYVPASCVDKSKKCRLHVAFHGCKMGQSTIGDTFVRHGGYNEVGELNDIIILYPQAISTVTNPDGCWDTRGFTGPLFESHNGYQPTAIKRMIDQISN